MYRLTAFVVGTGDLHGQSIGSLRQVERTQNQFVVGHSLIESIELCRLAVIDRQLDDAVVDRLRSDWPRLRNVPPSRPGTQVPDDRPPCRLIHQTCVSLLQRMLRHRVGFRSSRPSSQCRFRSSPSSAPLATNTSTTSDRFKRHRLGSRLGIRAGHCRCRTGRLRTRRPPEHN